MNPLMPHLTHTAVCGWGQRNFCGISRVRRKNENNSSTVMQITSTGLENGPETGFVLGQQQGFEVFSEKEHTGCHQNTFPGTNSTKKWNKLCSAAPKKMQKSLPCRLSESHSPAVPRKGRVGVTKSAKSSGRGWQICKAPGLC